MIDQNGRPAPVPPVFKPGSKVVQRRSRTENRLHAGKYLDYYGRRSEDRRIVADENRQVEQQEPDKSKSHGDLRNKGSRVRKIEKQNFYGISEGRRIL